MQDERNPVLCLVFLSNNTQLSPPSGRDATAVCIRGSQVGLMQHDIVPTRSEVEQRLLRTILESAEAKVTEVLSVGVLALISIPPEQVSAGLTHQFRGHI